MVTKTSESIKEEEKRASKQYKKIEAAINDAFNWVEQLNKNEEKGQESKFHVTLSC
jgi:hypothetical protein